MDKDYKLGKRIAWLRENYGLEQKEAADKIGIAYSTCQQYEYGNPPSRKNINKILNYYRCSKSWLLTGEGKPYPGDPQDIPEGMLEKSVSLEDIKREINTLKKQEDVSIKISEDMIMAATVLESNTQYAMALHMNIRSFHKAVTAEDRILNLENKVHELDNKLTLILNDNKILQAELKRSSKTYEQAIGDRHDLATGEKKAM